MSPSSKSDNSRQESLWLRWCLIVFLLVVLAAVILYLVTGRRSGDDSVRLGASITRQANTDHKPQATSHPAPETAVVSDMTPPANRQVAVPSPGRFPPAFLPLRALSIEKASNDLNTAESVITDFGDAGLNQKVADYQQLSRDFYEAIVSDDQKRIRALAVEQGKAFPAMTRRVEPLSLENREKFNRYFFAIGPAWANLLLAGAGADLPTADSPPSYPSGSEPAQSGNSSP